MQRYKVLGTNDDSTTCEVCGKTNLKRVVWLATLDADGNHVSEIAVGVDCAARMLGRTVTRIQKAAREADAQREREEASRVHLVGESRSVVDWTIYSVDGDGKPIVRLTFANGNRKLVYEWACERWPLLDVDVLRADGIKQETSARRPCVSPVV